MLRSAQGGPAEARPRQPRCRARRPTHAAHEQPPPAALPRRDALLLAGSAAASALLLRPSPLRAQDVAPPPAPAPAGATAAPRVPRGAPLGAAGVTPSAVVKGCWQLSGGHRGDAATDRTAPAAAVEDFPAFVAAGIDTFDMGPAACGYGGAESVVGDYLRRAHDTTSLVFTKLCCVGGEQRSPSREWVAAGVGAPLRRLGRARLDLMQLYWDDSSRVDELLTTSLYLQEERGAGRVGAVGFTNFNTATLERIRAAGCEVASHQIQFSLLDRRPRREQLAWAGEAGCYLLPYGVLAGGLLSDRYLGQPAESVVLDTYSKQKYASVLRQAGGWAWLQRLLGVLRSVADAHGGAGGGANAAAQPPLPLASVAARWVLQQPRVGALILGARNAAHVGDTVGLFGFELTPGDLERIEAVLAEGPQPKGDTYEWERGGVF